MRNLDSVQNTLCGSNLIRSHDHQHILSCEDTVPGQDIQKRMSGKECLCKVNQIRNDTIVGICPEGCKFKAVACLFLLGLTGVCILNGIETGTVGVVLRIRTIRDNKDLSILKQPTSCPEGIPLVAIDLIEGFSDSNTSAFQFDMNERKSIDQNSNIISVIVLGSPCGTNHVLVDDLQEVIMDIFLINDGDVLGRTIITLKNLNIILLNLTGLLHDSFIGIGNGVCEEAFPLILREVIIIQFFQLKAQIGNQIFFSMDLQIFISLFTEQAYEFLFQFRLRLVTVRTCLHRLIFCNDCIFACRCHYIKEWHTRHLLTLTV